MGQTHQTFSITARAKIPSLLRWRISQTKHNLRQRDKSTATKNYYANSRKMLSHPKDKDPLKCTSQNSKSFFFHCAHPKIRIRLSVNQSPYPVEMKQTANDKKPRLICFYFFSNFLSSEIMICFSYRTYTRIPLKSIITGIVNIDENVPSSTRFAAISCP